uniref:Tubulin-specific chaperone A n=1 Tax=Triticum urartu TaxID=4572 RepID=A0A8R7QUQ6_TRIUA
MISSRRQNVLAESRMMIPDCHKRLEATLAELEATLAELKESGEQGDEIGEAESVITEVKTVFEQFEDQLTSQERRCVEVLAS